MRPDAGQRAELEKRFRAGQQCYNACLGEALRRARLMRDSRLWQCAAKMPKGKERNDAFAEAREEYGLRGDRSLQPFVKKGEPGWASWLTKHIDSQVARKMAVRAYRAVNDWLLGERGRPHFKGWFKFSNLEGGGVPNGQSIRFLDGRMVWSANRQKLIVPCEVDHNDPHTVYALRRPIKFSRILRRRHGDDWRYELQIVLEGEPLNPRRRGDQVVGIDPGIGTFGIVGDNWAHLVDVAAPLKQLAAEGRRLRRRAQRQLQQNNPDCFTDDGQYIKGTKIENRTNGWRKTQQRIREAERRLTETRKTLHGCIINALVQVAAVIVVEANSYRAFQGNYGRAMRRSAPGEFVRRLKQRADELDVEVVEAQPHGLRPSQFCHGCGGVRKKPLCQRVHEY
ncbi:MAG: transposase, partial [Gemmatimonadota bacterium]|nr:transposase [Gemmatimonadota bacterium]